MVRTLAAFCCLLAVTAAQNANNDRIIDLSHVYHNGVMGKWPSARNFVSTVVYAGPIEGVPNSWIATNDLQTAEHSGTHVDAPYHFSRTGQTAETVPWTTLNGPAVVIDIRSRSENNADATATVQDLLDWEKRNGRIPKGAIIFVNTGWAKFYGDQTRYTGVQGAPPGFASMMHFPGPDEQFAKWLIENRDINGIGADTPSCDYGQTKNFGSHNELLPRNKMCIENVNNLDSLPEAGWRVFMPMMKIRQGTAGPTRIFAIAGASNAHSVPILVLLCVALVALLRNVL